MEQIDGQFVKFIQNLHVENVSPQINCKEVFKKMGEGAS